MENGKEPEEVVKIGARRGGRGKAEPTQVKDRIISKTCHIIVYL